jgi:hypothetical protein
MESITLIDHWQQPARGGFPKTLPVTAVQLIDLPVSLSWEERLPEPLGLGKIARFGS